MFCVTPAPFALHEYCTSVPSDDLSWTSPDGIRIKPLYTADDLEALEAQGIVPIDVVVVNLYPFARAAADPGTEFDALIEEIDIGGPTLVRAAAKNFQDVLIVVDPSDYREAMEQLDLESGPSADFRLSLAAKAFAHTHAYDETIAGALASVEVTGDGFRRRVHPGGQ